MREVPKISANCFCVFPKILLAQINVFLSMGYALITMIINVIIIFICAKTENIKKSS